MSSDNRAPAVDSTRDSLYTRDISAAELFVLRLKSY